MRPRPGGAFIPHARPGPPAIDDTCALQSTVAARTATVCRTGGADKSRHRREQNCDEKCSHGFSPSEAYNPPPCRRVPAASRHRLRVDSLTRFPMPSRPSLSRRSSSRLQANRLTCPIPVDGLPSAKFHVVNCWPCRARVAFRFPDSREAGIIDPRGRSERVSAMTKKVITFEFVVPTVLAIALGILLSIGAVFLTDKYLGPIDQAEANFSAAVEQ